MATLREAVSRLASVCDGAVSHDDQGFAGGDVKWGHYFADLDEDKWGDDYRYLVHKRLRKYRGQLSGFGIDYDSLPKPPKPTEVPRRLSGYDHKRRVQREEAQNKPRRISLENGKLRIEFPYSPELVAATKKLPASLRTFDPRQKVWYAEVARQNVEGLRTLVRDYKFEITNDAAQALRNAQTATIGTIKYTNKGFAVHMNNVDWDIVGELRTLRNTVGGQYEGSTQTNYIPDAPKSAVDFAAFVERHKDKFDVDPKVAGRLTKLRSEAKRQNEKREQRREAANATELDIDYDVPGLKIQLRPFQKVGVHYVVELAEGRAMIADEQGLGKTIEALAAAQKKGAFPLVVVCPSHLKENWANEIFLALGDAHSPQLVSGRKPRRLVEDIIIINYEILKYHTENILKLGPKALIIDESQAVKTPDSDRTKAVKQIADALPKDSMIIELTGTPIPNRPIELISQLDILGKLDDFGGFKGFVTEYVGWDFNGYGYNFTGAIKGNMPKLNEALREAGYIRRLKKDVLADLPEIQRTVVPMDMSAADRKDYQNEFARLREYARKNRKKKQAIALEEIGMLRQLTAKAKFESVRQWVETFLESGEKLILFAYHRDIQDKLREAFPEAAVVMGKAQQTGQEQFAEVQRFQNDPDTKLIICSLAVANTGLTLTAASNVAFVELGWNPSIHDQAEARCYGRVNDPHGANAYYLLAKNTIDEKMGRLIESKRAIVDAAVEGQEIEQDIRGDLVDWLIGEDDDDE